MKTHKSIRIEQSILEQIESLEDSLAASIDMILETFLLQRKMALRKLQGKFSRDELIALCDIYNGVIFEKYWMFDKESIVAEIEDAERFESISTRHNLNMSEFINHVRELTDSDTYFLLYEIYRFWHVDSAYGSPRPELEKFIKMFV